MKSARAAAQAPTSGRNATHGSVTSGRLQANARQSTEVSTYLFGSGVWGQEPKLTAWQPQQSRRLRAEVRLQVMRRAAAWRHWPPEPAALRFRLKFRCGL